MTTDKDPLTTSAPAPLETDTTQPISVDDASCDGSSTRKAEVTVRVRYSKETIAALVAAATTIAALMSRCS